MLLTNEPPLAPIAAYSSHWQELAELRTRHADICQRLATETMRLRRLELEASTSRAEVEYQQSAATNCKRRIDEIIDTFGDS